MLQQDAPPPDAQPLSPPASLLGAPNTPRRVAVNMVSPFVGQLFTKLLLMGYLALQYRRIDASLLGFYLLAGLLFSYTSTVAEWGMGTLVSRDVAKSLATSAGGEATSTLFYRTLALRLLISLGMFVPVAIFTAVYLAFFRMPAEGAWSVAILTLSLLPSAFSGSVTALLYAHERMSLPAGIGVGSAALNVALGVAAILLGSGIVGLSLAASITTLATALIFLRILRRNFPHVAAGVGGFKFRIDGETARSLLAMGWPLMLNALLVGLFFKVDQFIIGAQPDGSTHVARYQAAYSFLTFVLLISPAVTLALFPRMSRYAATDRSRLLSEYGFALKMLLAIAVPIVALTVWFAPLFISVLAGDDSRYGGESTAALQILIFFLPFSFINGLTQYVLIAVDRQRLITRAFGITMAFNVVANLLLVPLMGINGAAVTTILSEVVLMLPFMLWIKVEVGGVPLLRLVWKPMLAGLVTGAVAWLLWGVQQQWRMGWGALALYVAASVGLLAVYVAVFSVLRPLTHPEVAALKAAIKRDKP